MGGILGGLFGGGDDGPSYLPPPPQPTVVQAPTPEPVVKTVEEVKDEEPIVDTEAARVRASKRRKAAEDRRLFNLGGTDDETVILTKSLLGD